MSFKYHKTLSEAKQRGVQKYKHTLKYFHVKNCLHIDVSADDVQANLTCSNEIASFLKIKPRHADRVLKTTAN